MDCLIYINSFLVKVKYIFCTFVLLDHPSHIPDHHLLMNVKNFIVYLKQNSMIIRCYTEQKWMVFFQKNP